MYGIGTEIGIRDLLLAYIQITSFFLLLFISGNSLALAQSPVFEYRDWSTYVSSNPSTCLAQTNVKQSHTTYNGKPVKVRRGLVSIFTTYTRNQATGRFGFSPGFPVDPSKPVIMSIDGRLFNLRTYTNSEILAPMSPSENQAIIKALQAGREAIITSVSSRGTKAQDTFSLIGHTLTGLEASYQCSNVSLQATNPKTTEYVTKVTPGGGAVSLMELDTSERRTQGKLNGCELTYILAYEDYIYRKGAITFLRGSLNFSSFDKNPAFLLKVTAFDLQGNSAIDVPLSYAYLSSQTKSYAGMESTIVPSDDGGLLVMYPITAASSLSFLDPLTINISRKDGTTDLGIPIDVTSHDAELALNFANCALNLTAMMKKDME